MSIFGLILISGLTIGGCDSGTGKDSAGDKTAAADTGAVRILEFVNGVDDSNRGYYEGNVQVSGNLQGGGIVKMYLYETEGRQNIAIDSTNVTNNSFTFKSRKLGSGVYTIGPNENNVAPFIISGKESNVQLAIRGTRMEGALSSAGSKENEAFFAYMPQEAALNKQIKDNYVAGGKNKAMKAKYDAAAREKEDELARLQGQMIRQYPGTFFAKLLTWKQEPNRSEIGKYWDNADFTDKSIIHSMVLPDRIQNFMRWFSGGKEDGYYNCVDLVVEKAKANEDVLEFALYNMLDGFYSSGMENVSLYISDNFIFGDACGDVELSNVLKSRAEGIKNLRIGNVPPNINLRTIDGGTFDLYSTCGKNKYTLVFFWSSWCEHCKGEAPEFKALYDNYKSKGFEIIGVSVDTNKAAWEAAVQERGFTFPQVCGYKQWESPVAKDYKVTKTPTLFLLDKDKKIVLKPKSARETQAFLSQNLK
ncbi:MAG: hypothetical protein RL220_1825 [Bacteroidota bacterium]